MLLNCVAIPDEKSSQIISNIMHKLSDQSKSKNALEFVPHFSIRNDFEIETNNMPNLELDVKAVLRDITPFKLNVAKYGFYPWKIAYLSIDITPDLQRLHNALMETIQKYRSPMVPKTLLESSHFEGKQRQYIEQYGYQFAFEYYSPHFTVAGTDMSDAAFELLKKELETKTEHLLVTVSKIVFMNRDRNNSTAIEIKL